MLFVIASPSLQLLSQQNANTHERIFNPFKCEIGGFIGISKHNEYGFGSGLYLHPSYFITDQLNIGFKGESSIIFKADFENFASYLSTFQLTSRYYFSVDAVRMYTELGAGIYILNTSTPKEYFLGIAPKLGIDFEHFTTFLSYNFIIESSENNKNHLSLGVGFFIGGGKKK